MFKVLFFSKNYSFNKLLVILGLVLISEYALSEPFIITKDLTSIGLGKNLRYLEDIDSKLTLDEFLKPENQVRMLQSDKAVPTFGFTSSSYWFSLDFYNQETDAQEFLIRFDYPHLDNIKMFWLQSGELIGEQQMGDHNSFAQRPLNHRNFMVPFNLDYDTNVRLVFVIKTTSSFKVGVSIHKPSSFWQSDATETIVQGLYFGIMVVMIIYNAFIFMTLRNRSYFYYVLYVISYTIFQSCLEGFDYQYLWPESPAIHANGLLFCFGAVLWSLVHFVRNFLPVKSLLPKGELLLQGIGLISALVGVLSLFMPYTFSVKMLALITMIQGPTLIIIAVILIRSGDIGSRYFLLAFFCLTSGAVLLSMRNFGIIPSMFITDYASQIGSAFEVVLLSLALARRIKALQDENLAIQKAAAADLAKKNEEITFFNKNLEKLVNEKTKEIRVLLDYIPQGVLSLENDRAEVARDYSAHLETILGHGKISSTNFSELILNHCQMSADQKNLIEESISAIVGEEDFAFDMNEGNLPHEIVYLGNGEEKVLRVTWNVQLDDDGLTERLLITLMDVTSEKFLERQAAKQRLEMLKIEELLRVAPHKVAQFFETSLPLLLENKKIIEGSKGIIDKHMLQMLFVNAHTVKGGARTLCFQEIASTIHETEDYYSNILKKNAVIDYDRLIKSIERCIDILQVYLKINREKLNRSNTYTKVSVDRDFIENHYHILTNITSSGETSITNIIEAIRQQSDSLTALIFDQVEATFRDYIDKANKLAKDLGKASPKFNLNIDDISISPETKVVLENCMIHIFRNILDHGIEKPEQRKSVGKKPEGTISIMGRSEQGNLRLRIEDDGCGLAIKKLREIGLKDGKFNDQASLQEIADTVFDSGVSTAEYLSDISGRGVGLNAVRTFLDGAHGKIEIVLLGPKDADEKFYNFYFEISLPIEIQREQQAS
ncbi:MAG: hypothetical protein CMP10_20690 [Zetaproteobacteria bacterium]|nr:hypothetical protein [Pseudobdellovibrionaceae bacterium]